MNQRWYDQYASISLAINLLQTASLSNRAKIVKNIQAEIQAQYPGVTIIVESERRWLMKLFQKRRSLDEAAWMMIENLKYLTDDAREEFAHKIINQVYSFDHEATYAGKVEDFFSVS